MSKRDTGKKIIDGLRELTETVEAENNARLDKAVCDILRIPNIYGINPINQLHHPCISTNPIFCQFTQMLAYIQKQDPFVSIVSEDDNGEIDWTVVWSDYLKPLPENCSAKTIQRAVALAVVEIAKYREEAK